MADKKDWFKRWGLARNYRLIALGALGVLLLVVSSLSPGSSPPQTAPPLPDHPAEDIDYHQRLTRELEQVLSSIAGAGKVQVMLKLSSQPEQVLAVNQTSTTRQTEEMDSQGVTRQSVEVTEQQQPVLSRHSTGGEEPVVTTVKKPLIEGVLVVCGGGASSQVRNDLARAVATLLDLPIYRIRVLPMD